jgi:hypothetical protein
LRVSCSPIPSKNRIINDKDENKHQGCVQHHSESFTNINCVILGQVPGFPDEEVSTPQIYLYFFLEHIFLFHQIFSSHWCLWEEYMAASIASSLNGMKIFNVLFL